mgnify:CR=1 FL=1
MNIRNAEKLVLTAWEESKKYFSQNTPSERVHSWEQADESSLRDLDEYFQGSSYRFAMLISKLCEYAPAGAKVIDAGAGHGVLALALKKAGFDAYASDIHKGLAVFDAENIPYHQWHLEAENAPFADDSFDAVILSQTIEHFTFSPLHPLKEIVRIVRPGGIIIVDAPNISCFRNVSRLIRGKSLHWDLQKHYLEQMPEVVGGVPYYDRHNHEYAREDLQAIGNFFGLSIEEITYYSSYNRQKRGLVAVLISQVRDLIKRWRKGIYAVYRLPCA